MWIARRDSNKVSNLETGHILYIGEKSDHRGVKTWDIYSTTKGSAGSVALEEGYVSKEDAEDAFVCLLKAFGIKPVVVREPAQYQDVVEEEKV
jgi:hypothetical protein